MPAFAVPLIMAAGSAVSSYLQSRNKQNSQRTSTTSPTMDPAYGPLQQMLIEAARARLANPTSLPANYEANGVNTINKSFDLASQGVSNNQTSRGLGASPMGASVAERLMAARAGATGQFRAGVPLAARELQDRDFAQASGLLNFGRGSTSTGTGSEVSGGSALGDAGSSAMNLLAFYMGQGAFGPKAGMAPPKLNLGAIAPLSPLGF